MIASPIYTPPRLVSQGRSTVEPKGPGKVTVQVLVNPSGAFRVMRVIHSTNAQDDAAAADIARHSTYAPARRNGVPVRGFYDFTVAFGANNVSAAASAIDALLHRGAWEQAKDAATKALAANPGDALVRAQLGVAEAFSHNLPAAVAAFDTAGTIPQQYAQTAMQAYALNAAAIAGTDPQTALVQAKKAVALGGDYSAYYALGVAEWTSNDAPDALVALRKASTLAAAASPAADARSRMNIEEERMLINLRLKHLDAAKADGARMDALDPSHAASGKVMAFYDDLRGTALQKKGDTSGAVRWYLRSAAADPSWAGAPEYTKVAIALASSPMPDYLGAKADADKAIAADPRYALAYYVAGVALSQNGRVTGSDNALGDADVYLRKAEELAKAQGLTRLAASISYFLRNHTLDSNLALWANTVTVDPARYQAYMAEQERPGAQGMNP